MWCYQEPPPPPLEPPPEDPSPNEPPMELFDVLYDIDFCADSIEAFIKLPKVIILNAVLPSYQFGVCNEFDLFF